MTKEEYIDHELRIRMLEHLNKSMNYKLNALIMLGISSVAIPMILKYLGG